MVNFSEQMNGCLKTLFKKRNNFCFTWLYLLSEDGLLILIFLITQDDHKKNHAENTT